MSATILTFPSRWTPLIVAQELLNDETREIKALWCSSTGTYIPVASIQISPQVIELQILLGNEQLQQALLDKHQVTLFHINAMLEVHGQDDMDKILPVVTNLFFSIATEGFGFPVSKTVFNRPLTP